jgi:IS5 family transposase
MLRVYFLQQWFDLSDPQAEDMLYNSEAMRRFAQVELLDDGVPDESTILRFRHLLEQHQLTAQMFAAVTTLLEEQRLLLKGGTIVDATTIAAPSSRKNATQTRDPETRRARNGNQWYFGMKLHVGTDRQGVVHSLVTTDAGAADITQLPQLLHGQETTLHGDTAYYRAGDQRHWELRGGRYRVNKSGPRTPYWDAINRTRSRTRARVEHVFHVIKRLWGVAKVRYRGLAENTVRADTACALANLHLLRYRLRPQNT